MPEEQSHDELAQKIKTLTGLEKPLSSDSDYVREYESDRVGVIRVEVFANDQEEEDIAQMEKIRTLFSQKEHQEIIHSAFINTLQEIGQFVPRAKMERLFPGLDINNPDWASQYDFNSAKIRVFVLSAYSFEEFMDESHPENEGDNQRLGGFTSAEVRSHLNEEGPVRMKIDLTRKKVIVLKEVQKDAQDELKIKKDQWLSRVFTEKEKEVIKTSLEETMVHELVHLFDVASDMPQPLMEGITEWYAQRIINRDLPNYYARSKTEASYKYETGAVSILMIAMLENGLSLEEIDKAFIGKDQQEADKVAAFLRGRYGEKNLRKIMDLNFKDSKDFNNFLIGLEVKQGSDFGNLSKITLPGKGRR
jgi:hypothetical protein